MGEPHLAGHIILIVEPEIDQFACNLQGALERMGAETLIVRQPASALERMRSFRFSACLINYDQASDTLSALIGGLVDVPIVLYGGQCASAASTRMVPQLAFAHASVDSITTALGRLLQSARD
jgi:hypothetical protein